MVFSDPITDSICKKFDERMQELSVKHNLTVTEKYGAIADLEDLSIKIYKNGGKVILETFTDN